MLDIKIKKLNKNVQLPKQSTQGAGGIDFYLPQPVRFWPKRSKKVPLGVAVEVPEGYVMLLVPRSSTWETPLRMPNSVGVIVPVPSVQIQEVDELSETSRGVGGFGSTGK